MATLEPTVLVEVELAGAGLGWTNISTDVWRGDGLTIEHGIRGGGPTDRVASTGMAMFTLRNDEYNSTRTLGYYSLFTSVKRSGWGLGIGCRIRLTDPYTAVTTTRFVGRIDAIDPAPGRYGARRVQVTAVDWMDEAASWALTPDVGEQVGQRGDQIITAILAEMPFQPTATSLDAGTEAYTYALDTSANVKQSALAEFGKLAASEIGLIYVKANGTLRSESRHSRLLDTTIDWTMTDTDINGLTMPSTRAAILNTIRVTSHPKIVDAAADTVLYSQANAILVAPSTTKTLLGPYRDPITGTMIGGTDVQPQIASTDYTANTQSDGSGTDITTDFVIVVTAGASGAKFDVTNNNASAGYLTSNQLRGKAIYDRGTVEYEARDSGSVTTNGEHAVTFDMPYQDSPIVAQAAADYFLSKYSDPFALAETVTVLGKTQTLVTKILTTDISDRVKITEPVTGLSNEFFVNAVALTVLPSRHVQVTYTLAPAADPFSGMYWVLGTSTLGTDTLPAPL